MISSTADRTPNLNFPYVMPGQVLKYLTQNEALRSLDIRVQTRADTRTMSVPPMAPVEGAAYIVPQPAGDWDEAPGTVMVWQDGAYQSYAPTAGWLVYVVDEAAFVYHDGSTWLALPSGGGNGVTETVNRLGVNATADDTNRLTVSAPSSLFNHAGSDHRISVNKASETDTSAVIFQTGFSGRAEFGLNGSDDFSLKVSADGQTFEEAFQISAGSATTEFKQDVSILGTVKPQVYDVTDLPTGQSEGAIAFVSDSNGNMAGIFFNGSIWLYLHNLQPVL